MKRIFLFVATNLAVILLLTLVINLLGLDSYLDARVGNYTNLLIFAAVIGFGGAFISLALSKTMAKYSMGVQVIKQPANETERWLVDTVRRFAETAHIAMPEVGIFDSPTPNAFATGARKNAALVAVSTGLLRTMRRDEVEAVVGHEIAHVANGDMVTLTLITGVVNTFVVFLARIIGSLVDSATRGNNDNSGTWHRLLRDRHGLAAGARPLRQHDRRVVLAAARIPRRRGRRVSRRHSFDDRRARGAQACAFP